MLRKIPQLNSFKQFCTRNPHPNVPVIEKLNRTLIQVSGSDVDSYLQGLITNDINHLSKKPIGSLFTLFLNTKGRVLYDAIIHKISNSNTYFIECEKDAAHHFIRHLNLFKVRRKIDIHDSHDMYITYALLNYKGPNLEYNEPTQKHMFILKDPRVQELGYRIISQQSVNVKQELVNLDIKDVDDQSRYYRYLRYSLGIGEGAEDHPPGSAFPLECNCDYLHGISFHKGCYIGQELTARTYHTGVVRKRLMPLTFLKIPSEKPKDDSITHASTRLGKLRGIEGDLGLALLRVDQSLSLSEIVVGDGTAKIRKPHWWPAEAVKSKLQLQK